MASWYPDAVRPRVALPKSFRSEPLHSLLSFQSVRLFPYSNHEGSLRFLRDSELSTSRSCPSIFAIVSTGLSSCLCGTYPLRCQGLCKPIHETDDLLVHSSFPVTLCTDRFAMHLHQCTVLERRAVRQALALVLLAVVIPCT